MLSNGIYLIKYKRVGLKSISYRPKYGYICLYNQTIFNSLEAYIIHKIKIILNDFNDIEFITVEKDGEFKKKLYKTDLDYILN